MLLYISAYHETKENYNEDNQQYEENFPELTLKFISLEMLQFIWSFANTLNMD